jgi:hypothetical protein
VPDPRQAAGFSAFLTVWRGASPLASTRVGAEAAAVGATGCTGRADRSVDLLGIVGSPRASDSRMLSGTERPPACACAFCRTEDRWWGGGTLTQRLDLGATSA